MNITIIGTGLIGCSMGMALKKSGHHIRGIDNNPMHLEKALAMGGIDEAEASPGEALESADVVILCIPVDGIIKLLPDVLNNVGPHTTVMDMGSTKEDICRLADTLNRRANFVAAHPMAGVEHSGPMAAHVDLFRHARVIICDPQKSSSQALSKAMTLLQELNMRALFMESLQHDRQLALVSHLPQFIAYALASLPQFDEPSFEDWVELGGGGLQSSIRLGKSSADMWMPVFQQNKKNLLPFIDAYMEKLTELKNAVEQQDEEKINGAIQTANTNYEKLNYRGENPAVAVETQGAPKVYYS